MFISIDQKKQASAQSLTLLLSTLSLLLFLRPARQRRRSLGGSEQLHLPLQEFLALQAVLFFLPLEIAEFSEVLVLGEGDVGLLARGIVEGGLGVGGARFFGVGVVCLEFF